MMAKKSDYHFLLSLYREEALLINEYVGDGYSTSYAERVFQSQLRQVQMQIETLKYWMSQDAIEAVNTTFGWYLLEKNGFEVDEYVKGNWFTDHTEYQSDLEERAFTQFYGNCDLDDIPF